MSIVGELEVLINGNNAGLMRGLRDSDQAVDGFAANFSQRLQTIGGGLTRLGGQITMITAPLAIALGAAATQAMDFDRAMTNVGAVLGKNREEMAGLREEILAIGGTAQAGPQAVALAFYDIVGGVADASTHMAILQQAIATSEAGAASLTGTTSALISVMNSYGFAADRASFASDVLTRIVGMGVGTMDEFAAALPSVASIAAQTGVTFEDLGAQIAFMTTKGSSASQATTYLRQAIVSLLNPNAAMTAALATAGIASGSAGLRMYGLAGVMGRLQTATGGSVDAMAEAVGSVEALQAVMVLNQPSFETFLGTFKDGIAGATEAARELQRESAAFQFDLLKAQLSERAVTVGDVLMPQLTNLLSQVRPLIESVIAWIQQNPQLAATIAMVAGAAIIAGPALVAMGFAISAMGIAIGFVTSPLGILIAGLVGLGVALSVPPEQWSIMWNTMAFFAEYAIGKIVGFFWDELAAPVGEALASIPQDTFVGIAAGVLTVGGALILMALPAAFTAISTAIGLVATAIGGALLVASPFLVVLGLIGGLVAAYATNWLGFRDTVNSIGDALRNGFIAGEQLYKILQLLNGTADTPAADFGSAEGLFPELIPGRRPPRERIPGAINPPDWRNPFRAMGGSVFAGQQYVVGERGAEMFVPRENGRIVPNNKLGDGKTITIETINISGDQSGRTEDDYRAMFVAFLVELAGR